MISEDVKKGIIAKAGFPMYVDYWDKYFKKMPPDVLKECIELIFEFTKTGEVPSSDNLAIELVLTTIIDNLVRDEEKRQKQSKANKANGKKGGRPRKNSSTKQDPKKDFREEIYGGSPIPQYSNKITEQQKILILSLAKEKKYKMKRNVDEFTKAEASECITFLQELKVQSVLPILGDYNVR